MCNRASSDSLFHCGIRVGVSQDAKPPVSRSCSGDGRIEGCTASENVAFASHGLLSAAVVLCEACAHGAVDGSGRTLVRGEARLVANVRWMNLLATPPDTF